MRRFRSGGLLRWLVVAMACAAGLAACDGEGDRRSPDASPMTADAGEADHDGGTTDATDGSAGGTADATVGGDAGSSLPEGRVKCYFGPNYNCTEPGQECCESRDVCYEPAEEPDFCPDG